MNHVSLCLLSYNRSQFITEAIWTARDRADYPLEIIVNDDGSQAETTQTLQNLLRDGAISKLILNPPGRNQGVGESIRVAFGAASGDVLVKADQDLLFVDGWARKLVEILHSKTRDGRPVGFAGLFHYHFDPVDCSKTFLDHHELLGGGIWEEHTHICASLFGIRREVFDRFGIATHSDAFAEDTELNNQLREAGYAIALADREYVQNRGFGVGPSTVAVMEGGQLASSKIHHSGIIFHEDKPLVGEPELTDALVEMGAIVESTYEEPVVEERFRPGIVITVGGGREANLKRTLADLDAQTLQPLQVVVIFDGVEPYVLDNHPYPVRAVKMPKHTPGLEQPRNVGVRHLIAARPECNFVWFLDSDISTEPDCLSQYRDALLLAEDRILIGPYEWLQAGQLGRPQELHNDGRTASFAEHDPDYIFRGELGSALACFGGNLVWPIERFVEVGGFHPELHHGRCEDGELGLRAASFQIPMSLVRNARGWHYWHPIDVLGAFAKNARDVPMLNAWHPWVEGKGLILTAEEGASFDFQCGCGARVRSHEYWSHKVGCPV